MKHIALIAHDNKKQDLLNWCTEHRQFLKQHKLYATGTTGKLIAKQLDLSIKCFKSGPLGGDQQIGAKIAENKIDMLVFFWDPLQAQPHDPDVKALLRLGVLMNIPLACNVMTANALVSSNLLSDSAYFLPE